MSTIMLFIFVQFRPTSTILSLVSDGKFQNSSYALDVE